MRAIEDLIAEHRGIERMLNILEEVADRLDAGRRVERDDMAAMLEFIQVFADRCHHAKEEDLLFPAMASMGISQEGGPIGVMLHEHGVGREHVREMAGALAGAADGGRAASQAFSEHARAYAQLLRQHIDKEDHVLYPLAERLLGREEDERLYEGFERVETDVIGAGRHEEFHRLLDRLEETYLGGAAEATH